MGSSISLHEGYQTVVLIIRVCIVVQHTSTCMNFGLCSFVHHQSKQFEKTIKMINWISKLATTMLLTLNVALHNTNSINIDFENSIMLLCYVQQATL